MLHLARKAFYPAPAPLSADARRHHLEVPGDDRVPRPDGGRVRLRPAHPHQPGGRAAGDQPLHPRQRALHRHHEDRGAQAGARQVQVRRRLRRRPPRRGKVPRQGAHLLLPQTSHRWDPKNQRPELWNLYNARVNQGESIRVFPLSNWTELDIWQYIHLEKIPIVPLYFAKERPVVERDGMLIMVDDDRLQLQPGEKPQMKSVRFRTLGCYPLTGAVESTAATLPEIIQEMLLTRTSRAPGPAHRPRPGRLHGKEETGRIFLKPSRVRTDRRLNRSESVRLGPEPQAYCSKRSFTWPTNPN